MTVHAARAAHPAVAPSSLRLPPSPRAAGIARAHVEQFCGRMQADDACDIAALLATELVANAVRHAGTELTVSVGREEHHLRIEVSDASREMPVPRSAGLLDESGRGLMLVDLLADSYGVEVHEGGKRVWARVRLSVRHEAAARHEDSPRREAPARQEAPARHWPPTRS